MPRAAPVLPALSVVTGGASGIGAAITGALAARGGTVLIADLDAGAAAATAARIGPSVHAVGLDVTDAAAVEQVVGEAVAAYGPIGLIVNNAGVGIGGEAEHLGEEHWRAGLELNLGGVVNGVRAAYPRMVAQGFGTILNTASLAGLMPVPGMLPYTMSKHAVVGLSLGLRAEAAPKGVRVSVLCPAFVDTPLLDRILEPSGEMPPARQRIRRIQPRLLTADRVAAAALRGLDRNRAVIPVGWQAHLLWRATRLSPELVVRAGARRPGT